MKLSKIQIIANLLFLLPAVFLGYQVFTGTLSANPIQSATLKTGRTSVYAILISLFCSPLANIFKMSVFHRIRKISGLYAFYYAFAHFLIFSVLDYQLNFSWILPELRQKPFLQIGLISLIALIPMAVTSLNTIRQKMGAAWKALHKMVYAIAALILLHVALASKGDIIDPAILFIFYSIAMLFRLPKFKDFRIKSLPGWLRRLNTFLVS